MPKYSFLLPAYKAKYLKEALNSILCQSFKNFEVLVSDDCSPENIKEIISSYKDDRIKYRRNETNIGALDLVYHWNSLLNLTNSEYIIMASDDDVYDSDFLQEINRLTEKYPDIDLYRSRVRKINEEREILEEDILYPEYQDELSAIVTCPDLCIANYVFRRETLISNGGFIYFPYAMGSDTATAIAMSKRGLATTNNIHFNYRISSIQISHIAKNRITDKGKMKAAVDFHIWMMNYITSIKYEKTLLNNKKISGFIDNKIRKGLLHCSRFYFGSLSLKEFFTLNKTVESLGCLKRTIDKIAFTIDYLNSRRQYK